MSRRTVIVTGAAGSIGRACCQRFLADGAQVIAIDIDSAALERMESKAGTTRGALHRIVADVTNEAEVKRLVAQMLERFGAISVLVNNAGGNRSTLLENTTSADWKADIELNLNAAYYLSVAVIPSMRDNGGGTIINIGSVNGINIYGDPGYSAAKAGLIQFTKFVAVEYGAAGIRANVVCPGTVQGDVWNAFVDKQANFYEEVKELYSTKRLCVPDDVAGPVFFLCSADARGINGSMLVVDGGLTAGVPSIMHKFSN